MTSLVARLKYQDTEHDTAVVEVQTSRCFYQVAIRGSVATVVGPGVEESYDFSGGGDMIMFEDLTYKGKALIAVCLLEETE